MIFRSAFKNTIKPQNQTAATNEHIFSDEMIAQILEIEAYMEAHPNEWVSSEDLFADLRKTINE